jgi:DNA-binding transcriptional regulator YhcF (GntR family)
VSEERFRVGVPAFVTAYDAIQTLIAREGLRPGQALPGEVALTEELGVDRLVVREALMLLQEDCVVARDAKNHWVLSEPNAIRAGFTDSFHHFLGDAVSAVRRVHVAVEPGSTWSQRLLDTTEQFLVWETVFARDDVLLASTLEFLVLSAAPPELLVELDASKHAVADAPTMLEALGAERRAGLTPLLWRLVQSSQHSQRLSWMELPLHGIPAALTVVHAEGGRPVYLAKNRFDLATFNLTVDVRN